MKIVRIFGGLGNQMFQYALALALQANGDDVCIDATCMRGYGLHNGFELRNVFNIKMKQASFHEIMKVAYPLPHYRLWQIGKLLLPKKKSMIIEDKDMSFNKELFIKKDNVLLEGYWQTERYFVWCRDKILNTFTFPNFDANSKNYLLAKEIQDVNSVSVHVRRGDYLQISNASGICTMKYYEKAIGLINHMCDPDIFVFFSDDIAWCKEHFYNLLGNKKARYVDWNNGADSFRDMQLMSLCKYNIIANSSFSWWGAWLNENKNKLVISPSKWMNGGGWVDIIPSGWITIDV